MGREGVSEGQALLRMASFIPSVFLSPFLYEEKFFLKRIYDESAAASSPSGIKGSDKGESLSSTPFLFLWIALIFKVRSSLDMSG